MLKKFFSYYKPHKRLFIIDFSSAVFVAILELAFPVAVQWFIDKLLPGGDWNKIVTIAILLFLVYILSTVLQYIVSYLGHKLGINIETDMREQLFTHVQRQSFRFFDNTKTGHIMSRITNDLFDIGELAHHGPEDFFYCHYDVCRGICHHVQYKSRASCYCNYYDSFPRLACDVLQYKDE